MALLVIGLSLVGIFGTLLLAELLGLDASGRTVTRGEKKLYRTGTDMARLLEQGLGDPVLRQTNEWENKARKLVNEWYD